MGQPLPEALRQTQFSIQEAMQNYRMQKYSGKLTLFRATKQIYGIIPEPTMGWDKVVTGDLEIHVVPAIHASMVQEPWVGGLVQILKPCIERAQKGRTPVLAPQKVEAIEVGSEN
jgi:thioesterase domain-containing protein